MAGPLTPPMPVEYKGHLADDQHVIDLQELGDSLQGLGKFTNSVAQFYLHGKVISDPRLYQVRAYAGPPARGSIAYEIVILMGVSGLPLYFPLLCQLGEEYIPRLMKAIIARLGRKESEVDKLVETISDMTKSNDEFRKLVHEGHMEDKRWLRSQIDHLTEINERPVKEFIRPIGNSCSQITIGKRTEKNLVVVNEEEAEALTKLEKPEIEAPREFKGVFEAVDTITGNGKFRLSNQTGTVRCKITDPTLEGVGNVYTHSLDTGQPVTVVAKAAIRDGELVQLFVSDGRF